ncbi:MAG: hypothetical protein E7604_12565 [Ruminococcaceae bacterium]|nr:hypothetical protein [Oscillospiraceae bacterium]
MTQPIHELLTTKHPLHFSENGKFRIMMLSDIHGGRGFAADETHDAVEALVAAAKPDLVIIAGDICGPGYIHAETTDDVRHVLDSITAPMERRHIPWAHVYGNHDDNYGVPNEVQQPVYESYPYCISKAGPDDIDGTGNYFLPVYAHDGDDVLFGVWGLDSHHSMPEFFEDYSIPANTKYFQSSPAASGDYDGPRASQVFWYWQSSQLLEQHFGHKVPSLMYMHIPTPEHALVTLHKNRLKFKGYHLEEVACHTLNSGLFSACVQRGDVKAIFCGHEHENNFCTEYFGIKLGYDGFLSYHACHNEDIRGCRLFDISADNPADIQTQILLLRDVTK